MNLWTPGRRKVTASAVVFVATAAYAVWKDASFAEFASALQWQLAGFLAAHAAQQIGTRPLPTAGGHP